MVECHARRAGEKIDERKAEKLDQLVDQLKGQIESKDMAEVMSQKIIKFSFQIPLEFFHFSKLLKRP